MKTLNLSDIELLASAVRSRHSKLKLMKVRLDIIKKDCKAVQVTISELAEKKFDYVHPTDVKKLSKDYHLVIATQRVADKYNHITEIAVQFEAEKEAVKKV